MKLKSSCNSQNANGHRLWQLVEDNDIQSSLYIFCSCIQHCNKHLLIRIVFLSCRG